MKGDLENHRYIGDYRLIEQLGNGSMGETFLTEHRFFKRPFILKALSSECALDSEFISRFEKELPALSCLEHPQIAKIHNASSENGIYFLIAEPIFSGNKLSINLDQYFSNHHYCLSEETILKIASQIASALDFAHERGIAHGGIKLSNIAIKETEEGTLAFLTDFGLSRIVGSLRSLGKTYLATASIFASQTPNAEERFPFWKGMKSSEPHYSFCQNFLFLAPEQKRTSQAKSSPIKADIFAFGVLLYYLLTSEFPEGYFELPSKKSPDLKWNWDLLICKCLQTDPAKRPENLFARIEEIVSSTTVSPVRQLQKLKMIVEESKAVAATSCSGGPQVKPILKPKEISRPSFDADPAAIFQIDTTISTYRPKPQEEKEIEPLLAEMVVVPSGAYMRGSNHGGRDEMPRHLIHLNAYAMDIHPVTNEQFVLFLEAMGGEKDVNNSDIIRLRESRIKRSGGKLNIESGYARHPVVGVTWYGAVAYAKWVGKRLPTEAEWEVASYGGKEDHSFPTGNAIEKGDANFFSSDTTPVCSYPSNGIGLYDMAGNVYEWCQDWYDFHFYDLSIQEPNNPKGPLQGVYRVLRGGCWKSSKEDLRCAHRHRNNPGLMNGTYGFRCAADVSTEL